MEKPECSMEQALEDGTRITEHYFSEALDILTRHRIKAEEHPSLIPALLDAQVKIFSNCCMMASQYAIADAIENIK